jgi:hypothetical protein
MWTTAPARVHITGWKKLCYDSSGPRDEENRDEDGAFLMSMASDDAWAAYHAAGGTWEAWVDVKLAEERERILAIVTEVIAHQQREMERTVLEMRAASRPMDGRDGRSLNVRGTYEPGASYFTLDIVVCDGASFIACRDNPGVCPGEHWQLIARQGKRGVPGPQGERGEKGRDGLSAPVIANWKLDVRTRTATPIYSDGRFGPALELGALFEQSEDK